MTPARALIARGVPWDRTGTLVGASFCLLVLLNQIAIGRRVLAATTRGAAPEIAASMMYWSAATSVVAHVLAWTTYAALVTAICRAHLDGAGRHIRFRDLFEGVGWAHAPLVLWAVAVAIVWFGSPAALTAAQIERVMIVHTVSRAAGYASGIALLTAYVAHRYSMTIRRSLAATCVPAAGIGTALALANAAAGVLTRDF